MNSVKKDKILVYISIIIIFILSIVYSYFTIDLVNKQKKIDDIDAKYNEINKEYEELHNKVENVLKENT
jgi:peptidoglycan hydrolase CwlO-like protein